MSSLQTQDMVQQCCLITLLHCQNSKIFSAFISIVFAVGLVIYMKKSKLGRAIRATAQNARAAKILGVDTEKVYAATFGINAALCGVAGALISITFTIHPYMGLPYTIRSFH